MKCTQWFRSSTFSSTWTSAMSRNRLQDGGQIPAAVDTSGYGGPMRETARDRNAFSGTEIPDRKKPARWTCLTQRSNVWGVLEERLAPGAKSEIGRILHLKSENRDNGLNPWPPATRIFATRVVLMTRCRTSHVTVQCDTSVFGSEVQDSFDFRFSYQRDSARMLSP